MKLPLWVQLLLCGPLSTGYGHELTEHPLLSVSALAFGPVCAPLVCPSQGSSVPPPGHCPSALRNSACWGLDKRLGPHLGGSQAAVKVLAGAGVFSEDWTGGGATFRFLRLLAAFCSCGLLD